MQIKKLPKCLAILAFPFIVLVFLLGFAMYSTPHKPIPEGKPYV